MEDCEGGRKVGGKSNGGVGGVETFSAESKWVSIRSDQPGTEADVWDEEGDG